MHNIVVLAFPGTEEKMAQVWKRFCALPLAVKTFDAGATLKTVLEDIMADENVDREFILVPANLMPVTTVNPYLLALPYVYVNARGERNHWGLVPVLFDKEVLVDFLPDNDAVSDEDFMTRYISRQNLRPVEVSYSYGNFITPAFRGQPCENVIIEAFIRKHFVYSNMTAWPVLSALIDRIL